MAGDYVENPASKILSYTFHRLFNKLIIQSINSIKCDLDLDFVMLILDKKEDHILGSYLGGLFMAIKIKESLSCDFAHLCAYHTT
jgi:hypothetical protein